MAKQSIKSASDVLAKWKANTTAAVDRYVQGVGNVRVAPGQAAAAAKQAYIDNTRANADKWAQRVGAVSLLSWQQRCVTKGAANIPVGVENADDKMNRFLKRSLPYIQTARDGLNNQTPRGSKRSAANRKRMLDWMDLMIKMPGG